METMAPTHDEVIAVARGSRLEVREIGARVRLRESLAPELVGREDLRQVALLLRRGPVLHERGAEHRHAAAVHELRRLGACHLLVEDDQLDDRRAAAPELPWPVEPDVAGLAHSLLPRPGLLHLRPAAARGGVGPAAHIVRRVDLAPPAGLLADRFFPGAR